MPFLLDTNICIRIIRGEPRTLLARLERSPPNDVAMSSITFAELSVGPRSGISEDARHLAMLARLVPVRPFDEAAAGVYGRITRELGLKRNSFDRLIAAHALSLDTTLVTDNERDFADIPGLLVENWTR